MNSVLANQYFAMSGTSLTAQRMYSHSDTHKIQNRALKGTRVTTSYKETHLFAHNS